MYFTPAIFIAKLLATMQVLMTLDMPLSTTMALPVTSKPIESTVENLAWQAWIELPPEQKQQVKSRKVTPKSIFTLPLRVECPEGHKQVDTKCIPIVVGSNDVLIDLNALGLLVGETQTDDVYDYDDMGEENINPLPFGGDIAVGDDEESGDGLAVELKPPSKDEPLKFNIFENKFHIFHEEPLEDYSSISNEGVQSSEKEQNFAVTTAQPFHSSSNSNITATNDVVTEASNISKSLLDVQQKRNFSSSDSEAEESEALTTLSDNVGFKVDAISIPVFDLEETKQNKLNDTSMQLVTSIMDTETTRDDRDQQPDSDIQTLLQTESLLPMLNHTTATTLLNTVVNESISLPTLSLQERRESFADNLSLNIDEEITTLPNSVEQYKELQNKQEHTRSVTMNPMIYNDSDSGYAAYNGGNDEKIDSTLEIVTNDEPLETSTPIQLDETTIIETQSSLSTTSLAEQELKEFLLQQEQIKTDFEELQRMRKDQKDQHVVLKKSKVQPVEVLFTTTEATTTTTPSATTSANFPAETKSVHELMAATSETVIPLLTVHNENDNNDRFYYQHFSKQQNDATLRSGSELEQETATTATAAAKESVPVSSAVGITATKSTTFETIPLTSETDLAEEFPFINEPAATLTAITTMQMPTTTTITTEKPLIATTTTNDFQPSLAQNSTSESSIASKKPTLSTSLIWSKIMPLLTTSSTTPMSKIPAYEKLNESNQTDGTESADSIISSSARSNRNSKIIRINGFNSIAAAKSKENDATTQAAATTTTILYDFTTSTTTSSSPSSSTENNTYEPYWWLPVSWRLDKPTSSEKQQQQKEDVKPEEQSLLLRFWSAYVPKSR